MSESLTEEQRALVSLNWDLLKKLFQIEPPQEASA